LKPSVATLFVRAGAEASCPENPVDVLPVTPFAPPLSEPPPQAASASAARQAVTMLFAGYVLFIM
jgi:hypothetical protein